MQEFKRRDFLKSTVIAGIGGSLVIPDLTSEQKKKTVEPVLSAKAKKVIVAGAGISGLCCAYELMKSGHDGNLCYHRFRRGGWRIEISGNRIQ